MDAVAVEQLRSTRMISYRKALYSFIMSIIFFFSLPLYLLLEGLFL